MGLARRNPPAFPGQVGLGMKSVHRIQCGVQVFSVFGGKNSNENVVSSRARVSQMCMRLSYCLAGEVPSAISRAPQFGPYSILAVWARSSASG